MERRVINLDDVLVSPQAYQRWQQTVREALERYRGSGIDPSDIPNEQGRVEGDGRLTIFVTMPDKSEVSMSVPADQWKWR